METCRVLALYGEELSSGATSNYLGRMYRLYDSAGSTRTTGYDHQGHPLGVEKQLARFTAGSIVDVDSTELFDLDPDWTGIVGESFTSLQDLASDQLELVPSPTGAGDVPTRVETYVSSSDIDALGRPTEVREAVLHGVTTPPKTAYTYDRAGAVASITTTERDGTAHALVTYLEHNARGQRTRLERHDGQVTTSYGYDPHSFRLTRMETKRAGSSPATLEDLNYWYDAGGNITRIEDDSQQTVYFGNQAVDATRVYTYDALYRLTSAEGREHADTFGTDPSVRPESMVLANADWIHRYDHHRLLEPLVHAPAAECEGALRRGQAPQTDAARSDQHSRRFFRCGPRPGSGRSRVRFWLPRPYRG